MPAPLPEFYRHYYDYPTSDFTSTLIQTQDGGSYVIKTYEFPFSLPQDIALESPEAFKRNTEELAKTDQKTAKDQKLRYLNRVDLYVPKKIKSGEKRPAILVSPILGGNMVVDRFCNYYAGRGYVAALVHRKRLLWDDGREDIQQMEDYMRSSIIRLRQAVDWLEKQPEVDSERLGAFGISYGAILHSVLAAVEPRIQYHVLAMPAAPLPEVMMHCPDSACVKIMKHVKEKYGWSDAKIFLDLKRVLKTDPIRLAGAIKRDRVEIYIALFDRVVGAGRSWKLWHDMGKPRLRLLPFGHYGGIFVFPYLQTQSFSALKKHLQN
ncbi:MAG: dienelactone hydrolase family protein [Candidatus Omnitrophica bacterium]|nr:dienelactone hydrolase family protein [Candidatus Omnitrophota bacterium]